MRWLGLMFALIGAGMARQHLHYLRARREKVQDRQRLWYPASTFHVATFLEVAAGDDVLERLGALRRELEAAGAGRVVYAGQAAWTAPSSQLGGSSWDGVLLVEYDSQAAYERAAASDAQREALAPFAQTYSHGMRRSRLLNLLLPQGLLLLRLAGLLRGEWAVAPFEPAGEDELSERRPGAEGRADALRALADVNADACVVVNLVRAGTATQRAKDRSYGLRMARRFAALEHGPMHVGRAVTVEGEAQFDQVAIVYYPGVEYFASMLESRFFNGIIDDKQLADTQAVPTVPVLARL